MSDDNNDDNDGGVVVMMMMMMMIKPDILISCIGSANDCKCANP